MLKTRIIPTVLMKGRQAVKGKAFRSDRMIGQLKMTARVYSSRSVDELILLAVDGAGAPLDIVLDFADSTFAPLCVGGGIQEVDHALELLASGADKVSICTKAVEDPGFIERLAKRIGSQSVVVSIDVKDGEVFVGCGKKIGRAHV